MKSTLLLVFLFSSLALSAQKCYLEVSSGGGITGAVTVFRLTPDGKVVKGTGLSGISFSSQASLSKSQAKEFLKRAEVIAKEPGEFNHPGNLHHSLLFHDEKKEKKLVWGDGATGTPENALALYKEIQQQVSTLVFVPIGEIKK